jgi:hypothetical protein
MGIKVSNPALFQGIVIFWADMVFVLALSLKLAENREQDEALRKNLSGGYLHVLLAF